MLRQRLCQSVALAAGLVLATAAAAQSPSGSDLLEEYRNRNAVAAQQFENDIRDAIVAAQRLAQTDPAKAVERLRKALARVEDDKVLTPTRRESLLSDLKERIRVAQTDSRRAAHVQEDRTQRAVVAADQRTARQREEAEQEKIREQLNSVRALRREGKTDEAARLARDLAGRYPDNLAVQLTTQVGDYSNRVTEARQLRAESEQRRLMVYQSVDKSAMLPIGEIEFPKDWAEKTKRRKAGQNPLTEKEKAILESLTKIIKLKVKDVKFYEAMDELEKLMGQSFIIDEEALKAANVTDDTLVSRRGGPTTARTVLRQLLSPLGLTYVIKEQAIYITTKEKARQMMVVRTYPLGDLLQLNAFLPPVLNQLQMAQTVSQIIDMIKHTVDPDSWADVGRDGGGTIAFDPITMSLVIKQSAEVHYMLGGIH
jgi:hypothetical protein